MFLQTVSSLVAFRGYDQLFNHWERFVCVKVSIVESHSFVKMSNKSTDDQECKFADSNDVCLLSIMEVESIQSVEIVNSAEDTESADIAEITETERKLDISEGFAELLTLATNTASTEAWDSSSQGLSKVVRTIEANMNKFYQYVEHSPKARPDDSTVLALVYLEMSLFYHNPHFKKEKLYIGEAYLIRCLKLLKDKKLDRKCITITVTAYFELSCLWSKLENAEKSKQYLYEVLKLYKLYTQEKDDYPAPICILAMIGHKTGRYLLTLDEIYWRALCSISMFVLDMYSEEEAQDQSILLYMHKLLKKYFKMVPSIMGRIEWTQRTMVLARLLCTCKRFAEAKSHIAAATFMMKQFYDEECAKVDVSTSPEKHIALHEEYIDETCKINLCWARYGIMLLSELEERFRFRQNNMGDEPHEAGDLPQPVTRSVIHLTKLQFTDLEERLQEFIAVDKDTYVTNYVDAKAVFQSVLKTLNEAKIYVKKSNHEQIHKEFVRCTSEVYKYLTYYERYTDNLIELHKKRVKALHDIMRSYYATADKCLYGYISLELAIATSALLDVQVSNFPIATRVMSSLEIKELVSTNMQNFQLCLDHFQ